MFYICTSIFEPKVKQWKRGNSSVGRARPCQGRGRGFESRFPLNNPGPVITGRDFSFTTNACPDSYREVEEQKKEKIPWENARVVELVDTLDLKSNGHRGRAGSSPASSTGKPAFRSRLFLLGTT